MIPIPKDLLKETEEKLKEAFTKKVSNKFIPYIRKNLRPNDQVYLNYRVVIRYNRGVTLEEDCGKKTKS